VLEADEQPLTAQGISRTAFAKFLGLKPKTLPPGSQAAKVFDDAILSLQKLVQTQFDLTGEEEDEEMDETRTVDPQGTKRRCQDTPPAAGLEGDEAAVAAAKAAGEAEAGSGAAAAAADPAKSSTDAAALKSEQRMG
jgi:hypothetical protein